MAAGAAHTLAQLQDLTSESSEQGEEQGGVDAALAAAALRGCSKALGERYDELNGGFGGAPKASAGMGGQGVLVLHLELDRMLVACFLFSAAVHWNRYNA